MELYLQNVIYDHGFWEYKKISINEIYPRDGRNFLRKTYPENKTPVMRDRE